MFFLFHDPYLELALHLFSFWVENLVVLVVFVRVIVVIQRPSIAKKEKNMYPSFPNTKPILRCKVL
jgi:hypothetical protein